MIYLLLLYYLIIKLIFFPCCGLSAILSAVVLLFLFALGSRSCTESDCQWLLPAHVTNLSFRPIAAMNFRSAKKQKRDCDDLLAATASQAPLLDRQVSAERRQKNEDVRPAAAEITAFYRQLSTCAHLPAVLTLVAPHCDTCVTDRGAAEPAGLSVTSTLPLCSLYSENNASLTLAELLTVAQVVDYSVSDVEAKHIELVTRDQSKCRDWFLHRTGRVTASKLKNICRSTLGKPSVSLLRSICYPVETKFSSQATQWGIESESGALEKYKEHMVSHTGFVTKRSGLVINPDFAFMGASPDSVVKCDCCGTGVVEIKCPYKYRNSEMIDYLQLGDNCFSVANGNIELDKSHQYYYQIQALLHVCNVAFCDFVVCTFPGGVPQIFVQRLVKDAEFWNSCLTQSLKFFNHCILPELLGKAFTRSTALGCS